MVTVLRAQQNGGVPVLESDEEIPEPKNYEGELDISMFHSKK